MKKITRVLMSIPCLVLLAVFTTGCADKVDKNAIRQDQDRIVEYIKEKVELNDNEAIKKIEFKGYEENFSTGYWSYDVILNDKITISFLVKGLGGELLVETYKGGKLKFLETNKKYNNDNAEVIYAK